MPWHSIRTSSIHAFIEKLEKIECVVPSNSMHVYITAYIYILN